MRKKRVENVPPPSSVPGDFTVGVITMIREPDAEGRRRGEKVTITLKRACRVPLEEVFKRVDPPGDVHLYVGDRLWLRNTGTEGTPRAQWLVEPWLSEAERLADLVDSKGAKWVFC